MFEFIFYQIIVFGFLSILICSFPIWFVYKFVYEILTAKPVPAVYYDILDDHTLEEFTKWLLSVLVLNEKDQKRVCKDLDREKDKPLWYLAFVSKNQTPALQNQINQTVLTVREYINSEKEKEKHEIDVNIQLKVLNILSNLK